ncbi:hypothetical protein [Hafnia alvei]|uniref:hypothetical protein n=1 Tax=Hafnia alvei TaxID=569 RepID=UPI000DFE9ED8|nr:hypothetical protein [Hafnia alvei]STQ70193.1 Uncharacterised protein [Hafnia alvei]
MHFLPLYNLNSWLKITSGTGTITIKNGGRSAIFDGVTGSGAQIQKNLAISPTGVYKISFFARKLRGKGNVWISDGAIIKNQVEILEGTWERYEITGSPNISNNPESSFIRLNIGIAIADDGSIEVSDVVVGEDVSSYGSLKCIAAGIISLNSGTYKIEQNYGGIVSVAVSSTYTLEVMCTPLSPSVQTPFISVTPLDSIVDNQTIGRIQPKYYEKATGLALFRFLNSSNSPVGINTISTSFSFKVETI